MTLWEFLICHEVIKFININPTILHNTNNVFYTGISPGTLDPAYTPNYITWSTSINVSGRSTSATVTYYTATIYIVASTVASGATTGNILTIHPNNNIYLDGDTTCRTRIYA